MGNPALILNINDYDPTGTLHIRDQFSGKMRRCFRWLRGRVNYALVEKDVFGMIGNVEVSPGQFRFNLDKDKIQAFMAWFANEMRVGILEGGAAFIEGGRFYQESWMDQYLGAAYEKGVVRARQELVNAGYPVQTIEQAGGLSAVMSQQVHINRTALIYMRAYEELKGITAVTGQQVSRELADGMAQGLHPRQIASNINKNVESITKKRSVLLARTETIRSHHMANMAEYRAAQVMGIKIRAEFQTAGHGVCQKCIEIERENPYTLDEAERLIPVHPDCRCVALPLLQK